jgi:molybdenum cofactor guanylyltransferase
MAFSAAILAGGRSSRFGLDKASYPFRGKPLLSWVLDSLQDADERFIVSRTPYPYAPVFADILDIPGPLSGIYTALSRARYDWVAIAACDMPFLTPDYWQTLLTYCAHTQAVVVESKKGLEPLAALYHRDVLTVVKASLEQGNRAVYRVFEQVDATILKQKELMISDQTFYNINFQDDVSRFEAAGL